MLKGLRRGSFKIARVWNTNVRIHFTFVVVILYFLLVAQDKLSEAILLAALFGSVFLHELGHVWGARRMGLRADEVILWPLGGVAPMEKSRSAKGEFVSTSAGPFVNLALLVLGLLALALYTRDVEAAGNILFGARQPAIESLVPTILRYVVGANFILFFFNIIPAFPLDGGAILRSMIWGMKASWRTSTLIAGGVSMACGLGMIAACPLPVIFGGDMVGSMLLAIIGLFVMVKSFGEFQKARTFVVLPTLDDDRMPFERDRP